MKDSAEGEAFLVLLLAADLSNRTHVGRGFARVLKAVELSQG